MHPITRIIDHIQPPTPELTAARMAYVALWDVIVLAVAAGLVVHRLTPSCRGDRDSDSDTDR